MEDIVEIAVGDSYCFLRKNNAVFDAAIDNLILQELTVSRRVWIRNDIKIMWHAFYDNKRRMFPQGLLGVVLDVLRKNNIGFRIVQACRHSYDDVKPHIEPQGLSLRDYQKHAIEHALFLGRCVINIGTGGGKTEVGACLAASIDAPVLWLINRSQLVLQTRDRVLRYFPDLPVAICAGGDNFISPRLTIATVQSLYRLLSVRSKHFFEYFRGLIVDECHQVTQDKWYRIALACTNAHWRFGLTGTVHKKDKVKYYQMLGACGQIVDYAGINTLIKDGYAAKPKFIFLQLGDSCYERPDVVFSRMGSGPLKKLWDPQSYAQRYMALHLINIVLNDARNNAIVNIINTCIDYGLKVLVLVSRIKHGMSLLDKVSRGVFLSGKSDPSFRQNIIKNFERSQVGCCIIATSIFDLGVDIPSIHVLILAGGGKSEIQTQQRIGRALRVAPGKKQVTIIDFMDGIRGYNGDYLYKHSEDRLAIARRYFGEIFVMDYDSLMEYLKGNE